MPSLANLEILLTIIQTSRSGKWTKRRNGQVQTTSALRSTTPRRWDSHLCQQTAAVKINCVVKLIIKVQTKRKLCLRTSHYSSMWRVIKNLCTWSSATVAVVDGTFHCIFFFNLLHNFRRNWEGDTINWRPNWTGNHCSMLKFQIDHFEIYAESISSKTEKVSKSSSKPQNSVSSNRKKIKSFTGLDRPLGLQDRFTNIYTIGTRRR